MDTLEGTAWSVLPNWGSEGWDAGSWPYIIFAVARTRDLNGELFGYGTCVEGDTATHWFRSQDACFESSPPLPPDCRIRTGNLTRAGRPRSS